MLWALNSLPFTAALTYDLSYSWRSSLSLRSYAQLWSRLLWALISLPFAAALTYDLSNCWRSSRLLWELISLPFAAALSSGLGCFGRSFLFPLLLRSVLTSVIVVAHLFPFAAFLSFGLG